MADEDNGVRKRKKRAREVEPGSEISELADLIGTVNRIADRLQKTLFMLDLDFAVTDWLLLRALKEHGAMSMSDASRRIGVSRQRVHQQTKPLAKANLIEIGEGEANRRPLTLTKEGDDQLARLEQVFKDALSSPAGELPGVLIHAGKINARRLLRATAPKKDDGEAETEE